VSDEIAVAKSAVAAIDRVLGAVGGGSKILAGTANDIARSQLQAGANQQRHR